MVTRAMRKVIVFGDVILDEYIDLDIVGLSKEQEGVLITRKDKISYGLGGAANVANNIHSLGADTKLIAMTNTDSDGEILRELIFSTLPGNHFLYTLHGGETFKKTRFRLSDGRQLLRVDSGSQGIQENIFDKPVMKNYLKEKLVREAGLLAPIITLVNYDKGFFSGYTVEAIIDIFKDCLILVDPGRYGNWLPYSSDRTVFKVNINQCLSFLKANNYIKLIRPLLAEYSHNKIYQPNVYNDLWYNVKHTLDSLSIKHKVIVLTLGAGGLLVGDSSLSPPVLISSHPAQLHDATGCGDTVLGTMAFCLACSEDYNFADIIKAAELANKAARIAVQHSGCYIVKRDDIFQE